MSDSETVMESIVIGNAEGDGLTVTMRGDTATIIKVLVNGLPREALVQLSESIRQELSRRR